MAQRVAHQPRKKVSFCITCKDRLLQLQQTLGKNLHDNKRDRHRVEFVLVDFSTPGLQRYVAKHFKSELADGYLRYFLCTELTHWHASVAKNTSHRVAQGEILVNLDCDNFTGVRGGRFVGQVFRKFGMDACFHQRNADQEDATWGRIAMSRRSFWDLGGYSESFLPAGAQDYDLLEKFKARWPNRMFVCTAARNEINNLQEKKRNDENEEVVVVRTSRHNPQLVFIAPSYPLRYVQHSMEVKMSAVAPEYVEKQKKKGWSALQLWEWMNHANYKQCQREIAKKMFVNNRALRSTNDIGLKVTEPFNPAPK